MTKAMSEAQCREGFAVRALVDGAWQTQQVAAPHVAVKPCAKIREGSTCLGLLQEKDSQSNIAYAKWL